MKKQIEKIEKKERKLEHKLSDLSHRISELEKLSPAKDDAVVRFVKPSNEIAFSKDQRDILKQIDKKLSDMIQSGQDALNFKPKRK